MAKESAYTYDLFASYADADKEWVQDYLLSELGLPDERVITKDKFEPGHLQVAEFERAVTQSHYTLLVLSPDYLDDEWANYAGQLGAYFSVENRGDRLVHLLLRECELDLSIRSRVLVNCTDEHEQDEQIVRLRNMFSSSGIDLLQDDQCDESRIKEFQVPTGAVPLNSPLYVRRCADDRLEEQIGKSGTITTVRGARQTGKTSLLLRGASYAREEGAKIVYLSCQALIGQPTELSYDQFFQYLAYAIATRARVKTADVDPIWKTLASPQDKLTRFISEHLLEPASGQFVLVIDEADLMLRTPFSDEFFGLLRSWHDNRVFEPLWTKLNTVLAISTHPSLLIADIHQSPFNVGMGIQLEDFDRDQVQELNDKYGSPLSSSKIRAAMDLLGGHPYLIRQALYTLVCEPTTWAELAAVADKPNGPFGSHLCYYLELLKQNPECVQAAKTILQLKTCPPGDVRLKLESAGLITVLDDNRCAFRYGLYNDFFSSQLA